MKKLSSSSIEELLDIVFENLGAEYSYSENGENYTSSMNIDGESYFVVIDFGLEAEKIIVSVYLPLEEIGPEYFERTNEITAKLNANIKCGCFTDSVVKNRIYVRFKIQLDFEGADLYPEVIRDMLLVALNESNDNLSEFTSIANKSVSVTLEKSAQLSDCVECGHSNPVNSKFCSQCGSKMISACTKCGTNPTPGAKFCRECGSKL